MSSRPTRTFSELSADCERLLERAATPTFEETASIEPSHVAEAIHHRSLHRTYWA